MEAAKMETVDCEVCGGELGWASPPRCNLHCWDCVVCGQGCTAYREYDFGRGIGQYATCGELCAALFEDREHEFTESACGRSMPRTIEDGRPTFFEAHGKEPLSAIHDEIESLQRRNGHQGLDPDCRAVLRRISLWFETYRKDIQARNGEFNASTSVGRCRENLTHATHDLIAALEELSLSRFKDSAAHGER